ncbi:MAG: PilZ domain-containing protein [Desulfobacteraceae bacterium]|nr:PilZ domain-containing protein [Desulfobacteraceae bacterium]
MNDDSGPNDETYFRSLREYSRVDGFLPLQIRLVGEGECNLLCSRSSQESVLTEHPDMPETDDRVLTECLRALNAKLDTIIRMLAFQTMDYKSLKLEHVNISAGGIYTFCPSEYSPGDMVEVRFMLPSMPYTIFYVYGNVVRCEPARGKFAISVEFTEIDEDIRESIAKYVFERQREIMRKKRRP